MIKRRRENKLAKQQQQQEVQIAKVVNGDSLLKTNGIPPATNGNANDHHIHYSLADTNGNHHQQTHWEQEYQMQLVDIVEDEPYPSSSSIHQVQHAYNKLTTKIANKRQNNQAAITLQDISENGSLDSMEGSDDTAVSYIRSSELVKANGVKGGINGDATESSPNKDSHMWDKRNARSIDEGIRFKSQLSEGLEEESKLHRERLLSNLLESAIGGTKGAIEQGRNEMKNATNPFRWLGFGRGDKDNKDGAESKRNKKQVAKRDEKSARDPYKEIVMDSDTFDSTKKEGSRLSSNKEKKNRKFGARTIAGLISALAEEVEGLQVEVDADANTPMWNKSVDSIKIYFSRLGTRQLRMGGLDKAFTEFEQSMGPSEKFSLSSAFSNMGKGKPTTADEAFDKMDADNSGTLDEEELAQALKMAAIVGGNKFGVRSKKTLTELASRLVRLYDTNGDGVVDREEYQAMVQDMGSLRDARLREELHEMSELDKDSAQRRGMLSSHFGGKEVGGVVESSSTNATTVQGDEIVDVTESEEFWGSIDHGEGSIVMEDLQVDLRRLLFGVIPGVKKVSYLLI